MGSLRCFALLGVLSMPGQVTQHDLDWLSRHREAAFDLVMPLRPARTGVSVAYRRYRDLYHDAPEAYFAIVVQLSPDSFAAEVVVPDGNSIQEQLLQLHASNRKASLDSLIKLVRVKRSSFQGGECPAAEKRIRLLQAASLHVPSLDTITIHPVLHRVVVNFAGGELDANLSDDEHELVRWSDETLSELRRCGQGK